MSKCPPPARYDFCEWNLYKLYLGGIFLLPIRGLLAFTLMWVGSKSVCLWHYCLGAKQIMDSQPPMYWIVQHAWIPNHARLISWMMSVLKINYKKHKISDYLADYKPYENSDYNTQNAPIEISNHIGYSDMVNYMSTPDLRSF